MAGLSASRVACDFITSMGVGFWAPRYACRAKPAVVVESDPRSEVDLWMSGRGPNVLHLSTVPPTPPTAVSTPPRSTLLLEELMLISELVLPNQPLRCCFGELCGVFDGVDWAEELCRSSLASMLWICSLWSDSGRRWWCLVSSAVRPLWGV